MKLLLTTLLILTLASCAPRGVEEGGELIDKSATAKSVELYNRLFKLRNKGVMIGHQDALAYGHSWYGEEGRSDVKDVTGDYPAVIGWELGHLEIGDDYNLDSVYFADIRRYVQQTARRGGITTMSWHGDNIVTGNNSWDCAQDSVVRSVLEGGENHRQYLIWLSRLGSFFRSLTDDNGELIPVIFRMYHEHTGAWFWWGSKQCTPEEYKQLWQMTVEQLRDELGVHNLIYAYSPATVSSSEEYFERYPGDDYVDIVGFDCYVATGGDSLERYVEQMNYNLKLVTEYGEKSNKIAIIGETGMEGIKYPTYFTELIYPMIESYNISWVLFWRNAWESDKREHYYMPFEGVPAAEDLKIFSQMPQVLMNKKIEEKER